MGDPVSGLSRLLIGQEGLDVGLVGHPPAVHVLDEVPTR
jgi:hypothetical protein